MSREVSQKLSYLYFLMTGMVIGLHSVSVNSLGFLGISKDFNSYVRVFYDASTGSFFFFSAFLLFRKEHKYTELLKRKIYTLLIPYLIFNIIAFLYKDVLRKLVLYHSLSQYGVKELSHKILLSEANPPLWFIRVLIEFIIIYPIIRMILNNEILAGGGYYINRYIALVNWCKCWI